jgi:hypothetical protein
MHLASPTFSTTSPIWCSVCWAHWVFTTLSQILTWVSAIILYPPVARHISNMYNALHSQIISFTCFNTFTFTPVFPLKTYHLILRFVCLSLWQSPSPPFYQLSSFTPNQIILYNLNLWRYIYQHPVFQFSSFYEYHYFSFINAAIWIPFIKIFIWYNPYLYSADGKLSYNTYKYTSRL